MTEAPQSRLPVLGLVGLSYREVAADSATLARISLGWVASVVAIVLVTTPARGSLGGFLVGAYAMIGHSAVAVAWHRHLLLSQKLPRWLAPIDRHAVRYLVRSVLLGLVLGAAFVIGILLSTVATIAGYGVLRLQRPSYLAVPEGFLVAIAILVLLAGRLPLALPAAAIGDRFGLVDAWIMTRSQGLRLVAGLAMVALPGAAVLGLCRLADLLLEHEGMAATGSAVQSAGGVVGEWVMMPLVAAFLSFSYLWLRANPNKQPVPAFPDPV